MVLVSITDGGGHEAKWKTAIGMRSSLISGSVKFLKKKKLYV
jgi:hypothetical protein